MSNSLLTSLSVSSPSINTRFWHLAVTFGMFYLLYTLTNQYSYLALQFAPWRVHFLNIPLDKKIPFIPTMIVPYSWSLLLFCASFFMVRTPKQLSLLTQRLLLATVLSCLYFYLYPAMFAFTRPIVDDWTGYGYLFLAVADKPFNQFPSLHVSYALLLLVSLWQVANRYSNALTILYRSVLTGVCVFIILSTVLTYQHHVMDVAGGIFMAGLVLAMAGNIASHMVLRYVVIAISGFIIIAISGFIIIAIAGFYLRVSLPALLLGRFTESAFIMLAGYWLISFLTLAGVYQSAKTVKLKHLFAKDANGQLTTLTWLRFAPLLASYKLMAYITQYTGWSKFKAVQPSYHIVKSDFAKNINNQAHVVITTATPMLNKSNNQQYLLTLYNHITPRLTSAAVDLTVNGWAVIVVDVGVEVSSHYTHTAYSVATKHTHKAPAKSLCQPIINDCHYLYYPLLDLQPVNPSSVQALKQLFAKIDELITDYQNKNKKVIIINFHCVMGLSRSVAVEMLYLLYRGEIAINDYKEWLIGSYPYAHISDDYLPQTLFHQMSSSR